MSAARWMLRDSDRGSLLLASKTLIRALSIRKQARRAPTLHTVMAGHSRSKDGVASLAYLPAIPLTHARRSPRPEEARSAFSKAGPRRRVPAAHGSRRALARAPHHEVCKSDGFRKRSATEYQAPRPAQFVVLATMRSAAGGRNLSV